MELDLNAIFNWDSDSPGGSTDYSSNENYGEYSDGGEGAWSPVSCLSDQENQVFPPCQNINSIPQGRHNIKKSNKGGGKRLQQRSAANQRERRRMKTINEAFEGLREHIPLASGDRKLSKVDTLRLAIRYIHHLSDIVSAVGGDGPLCGTPRQDQKPEKIIIRCHNPGYLDYGTGMAEECPLYGHSLSWEDAKQPKLGPNNTLVAKLWVPDIVDAATLERENSQHLVL